MLISLFQVQHVGAEMFMHAVTEVCCSVILFALSIRNSRKLVVAICWCHICLPLHKLYLRVPAYPTCREGEMQERPETEEMMSCRGGMQSIREYLMPVTSLWPSGPQSIGLIINVCLTVWAMAPHWTPRLLCAGECWGSMIIKSLDNTQNHCVIERSINHLWPEI